jgi:hypothetical protein
MLEETCHSTRQQAPGQAQDLELISALSPLILYLRLVDQLQELQARLSRVLVVPLWIRSLKEFLAVVLVVKVVLLWKEALKDKAIPLGLRNLEPILLLPTLLMKPLLPVVKHKLGIRLLTPNLFLLLQKTKRPH